MVRFRREFNSEKVRFCELVSGNRLSYAADNHFVYNYFAHLTNPTTSFISATKKTPVSFLNSCPTFMHLKAYYE